MVREGSLRIAARARERAGSGRWGKPGFAGNRDIAAGGREGGLPGRSVPRRTPAAPGPALTATALALVLIACSPTEVTFTSGPSPTSEVAGATQVNDGSDEEAGPCAADQLIAEITRWEGAAGSRIALVGVTNNSTNLCILEGPPGAALLDPGGTVLIASNEDVGGAPDVELPSGEKAQLVVAVGNWCNDPPPQPVSIGLTMPDGAKLTAGPAAGVTFEPPPCNGPGQPPTISVQPESWSLQSES
jgi:hypothetical protein